jgi:Flp pilus assembly protein TadG
MSLLKAIRRFRQDESGTELVEFALCLSVLLITTFAILDGSRLVYLNHYVGNAARDGSRYAMVRGSTWAGTSCASATAYRCDAVSANVQSYVVTASPAVTSTAPLTVTTTWPGTSASGASCDTSTGANSPGCIVKVQVTYRFTPMVPFIPGKAITLSSTSTVTIAM